MLHRICSTQDIIRNRTDKDNILVFQTMLLKIETTVVFQTMLLKIETAVVFKIVKVEMLLKIDASVVFKIVKVEMLLNIEIIVLPRDKLNLLLRRVC